MTTDVKARIITTDGRRTEIKAVLLEYDERLLLLQRDGIFRAALPMPLCKHKHRSMEKAARCGIRRCQTLSTHDQEEK